MSPGTIDLLNTMIFTKPSLPAINKVISPKKTPLNTKVSMVNWDFNAKVNLSIARTCPF